jgi:RAP domain
MDKYTSVGNNDIGCLALPRNFPEDWLATTTTTTMEHNIHHQYPNNPDYNDNDNSNNISSYHDKVITQQSMLHNSISSALCRIGFYHIIEHKVTMNDMVETYNCINVPPKDKEVIAIDIVNIEEMIAIEVDGPYHYVTGIAHDNNDVNGMNVQSSLVGNNNKRNINNRGEQFPKNNNTTTTTTTTTTNNDDTTKKHLHMNLNMNFYQNENGSTVAKRNLLTLMGWKVLSIPYWEWDALDGDLKKEEEYCLQKLLK